MPHALAFFMSFFSKRILLLRSTKSPRMYLKRALFSLLLSFIGTLGFSQTVKPDKYPSLLWEISGNGMKKTSYLFGTMHVSSKLAFNLSDSFYLGIRNADVVALETNPESWQEDMSRYDLSQSDYLGMMGGSGGGGFNDYLRQSSLSFEKYEKSIQQILSSSPSVINNLLYRSYGDRSSDFEEDTYLDMHIYQCGKKWGKRVAGVESYAESMRLMMEAYKDAAKEKNNRKLRSYDYDDAFSSGKLQDAYRSGNLDLLDTINKVNSQSEAFDEKFLYRRNEIQADNIDSILRTNASLFVGVGAAHLPGQRGVIELLRRKGYTLRPVKMGARNSDFKASVEKIRVPVTFSAQFAPDSFYRVDVPGKLYEAETSRGDNFRQFADMANGSYYVVTRVPYSPWLWGHSLETVQQKIDSMLYENIPGRILERSSGRLNGYRHIDVTNKTRRGDVQRYRIFVTPFELVFFKMSGNADYVQKGTEAERFFNSIQFRNFKPANNSWVQYTPPTGGFTATFPHTPHVKANDTWFFDAEDSATQTNYRVIRMDIHNLNFAEEDTFDLGLMEESFATSKFIDSQVNRKQFNYQGYPALDVQYRDIQGGVLRTRYLIKGPHYYMILARGKKDNPRLQQFLESFQIKPLLYAAATERVDTNLYYRVQSPVFPEQKKEKLELINVLKNYAREEDESEENQLEEGMSRVNTIASDSTGEKVLVIFSKTQRYYYTPDSSRLEDEYDLSKGLDSNWIVRYKQQQKLANGMKSIEIHLSDSGSSRMLRRKAFIGNGVSFVLAAETDTLQASSFIRSFFDTFTPADTLKGFNPYEKKGKYFFEDFFSEDSVRRKRALKKVDDVKLFEEDIPNIRRAIAGLNWKDKKYLDTKKSFIGSLGNIQAKPATDFLVELYTAAGDTLDLQQAVLSAMVDQKTTYSFKKFRDIIVADPPVLMASANEDYTPYMNYNIRRNLSKYSRLSDVLVKKYLRGDAGSFLSDVTDSIQLARTILPDLLPLLNLDDYEKPVMSILREMVDSNMVKAKEYKEYMPKFLLKARQEVKRQAIQDQQKAIRQVEQGKEEAAIEETGLAARVNVDYGNEKLELYATLLLPYWDKNAQVPRLFDQMLRSSNSRVRYNTLLQLIRNNKPYPDSLVKRFADDELFAYELYRDLREIKKEGAVFPATSFNKVKLAKSRLIMDNSSELPDSIAYIDKLPMKISGRETEVYFFRYRAKKDDFGWKLAIVGPMIKDSLHFDEYNIQKETDDWADFTEMTATKLKNESEEPVATQLKKQLRKLEYSLRKSAEFFYGRSDLDMGYLRSMMPEDD
jgi:uncharacterized protein YbaP (TraB family)